MGAGVPSALAGARAGHQGQAGGVEAGITEFETEFLAHIVLPDGETVGSWMRPQLERAYAVGRMPELLPLPPTTRPALGEGER